jgi:hypothetical protein
MADRVYVHIGLPKTGTSYLQETLWQNRRDLARAGVLVPGESHRVQRFAVWDLLGRRLRGVRQPRVPGSWQQLVEAARDWPGRQVMISDDLLVHARPAHVRRVVRSFAPAEVHVVVTVRDLARVICSMWQQELAKGRTWPWSEFVAAVRDPEQGAATAGVAFWLRYDLQKVLEVWRTAVPAERVHVVVVPPPGSPPTDLLERFAAATGLDAAGLTPAAGEANTSVGVVETELLRRLNETLRGRLNERQYLHVMRQALKPALRRRTRPITLPATEHGWVTERSKEIVELLHEEPYDIVGDPDDLVPRQRLDNARAPDEVSDAEITQAAVEALSSTVERYAAYWWKTRPRGRGVKRPRARTRMASARRAAAFRAKLAGLEKADRNRLFARAALAYLRRTSKGRPVRRR